MSGKGKRRGALSNPAGRFEPRRLDPDDGEPSVEEGEHPFPPTTIIPEITRTIITRNDSPDVPFDRSINPYKGCEHGCIYCFARPTHSYIGLSPGLDFETKIVSKPDAARLLREELRRPGYRCDVMALGSNTDPYQPVERRLGTTRSLLEVLSEHDHPVGIVTKSTLVLRDLDLLASMARRRLAGVMISVTTLDADLAARMEPRAPAPARRLETLRALSDAGIPAGALVSPIIPGLTDDGIERILEACARAGAMAAGYVLLRLPYETRALFAEWLERHYPLKAGLVLSLLRQSRRGRPDHEAFGARMRGRGPWADLIRRRFEIARRRHGLEDRLPDLDRARFRPPARSGDQGRLFG